MAHTIQHNLIDFLEIELERINQQFYLVIKCRVEQRWIIRVHRYRYSRFMEARKWMLSKVSVDTKPQVTRWAYRKGSVLFGEVSNERGILNCPYAVSYTLGSQRLQGSPYTNRTNGFSCVRYTVQTCSPCRLKPPSEFFGWIAYLRSAKP